MTELLHDPRMTAMFGAMLLVYCRVQACILAMPGFSLPGLPARIRIALAMAMTPLLAEGVAIPPVLNSIAWFGVACLAELVTGLALGMLVRLFSTALDVAAAAIAATASLSQLIGAATEYSPHPIGNLLHLAGLAVLMAMGFPLAVCELLRDSFALRAVGEWPQITTLLPVAIDMLWQGFLLALMLAAPFILGGYLFQVLTGMISKVMPALPVTFIAAPGAILLALVALVLLAPATVSLWAQAVLSSMQQVLD